MTTEQHESRLSEAEVGAFLENLSAWAAGLRRNEREFLVEILVRAARSEAADAEGFMMKAQPYIPELRPVPSPDSGPGGLNSLGGMFLISQFPTDPLPAPGDRPGTFGSL